MTAFHLLTSGNSTASSSPFTMILLMVAMFAIMYFVMIRPQKKQQKKSRRCAIAFRLAMKSQQSAGLWAVLLRSKRIP